MSIDGVLAGHSRGNKLATTLDGIEHIVHRSHREATVTPLNEVVRVLQELLSRRLTAYIAGVADAKTVSRWAAGEVTDVRHYEMEQRLRTSYEIVQLLLSSEASSTVKAWFIGLNPQLDDVAPAEAIREGRLRDALGAARAFLAGG